MYVIISELSRILSFNNCINLIFLHRSTMTVFHHNCRQLAVYKTLHWMIFYCYSVSHWENSISICFHSEWDMIVVTVFEPNGNSIWFKNCHRDHIPFTVKGKGNIVFSLYCKNFFCFVTSTRVRISHWYPREMTPFRCYLCRNNFQNVSIFEINWRFWVSKKF